MVRVTSNVKASTVENASSKSIHNYEKLQLMSQQNNHISPEKLLEKNIRNVVNQISREKLLPKILWNAAREFGSKKLISYQKTVRKQYQNQLKSPIKYDPQQAKSDREKFRDKVVKLMNNQLEIDYLENVKLKDRTLITYNGKQLEQCKVSTKRQFEIFKNFNEKKFKETYSNLFEDKLEVDYPNLYQNKSKKRCHTLHVLQNKQSKAAQDLRSHQSILTTQIKQTQHSVRKTQRKRDIMVQSARKKPLIYFNEKKVVGNLIPHQQRSSIIKIIKEIGRYDDKVGGSQLCITRQSINKWLKVLYEKPNRIFDFFELPEVLSLNQFWSISKKLRVMPLQHVLFMTFLYYDGNNDGYICDYDLQRLSNLSLVRNVLTHDYQKIKQSGIKKVLTRKQAYLDLYKLSEVTESKFFDWKQKPKQVESEIGGLELQMKNRVLSSKQKHIFIDFDAFCHIYRAEKPFLWYDLMYVFSGTAYQGLKYQ